MNPIPTYNKLAFGAILSTIAVLGIVLSVFLGWKDAPRPWGFLLGFVYVVLSGLGGTLAIAGLIEYCLGSKNG